MAMSISMLMAMVFVEVVEALEPFTMETMPIVTVIEIAMVELEDQSDQPEQESNAEHRHTCAQGCLRWPPSLRRTVAELDGLTIIEPGCNQPNQWAASVAKTACHEPPKTIEDPSALCRLTVNLLVVHLDIGQRRRLMALNWVLRGHQ